jgi:VWFA-related protein
MNTRIARHMRVLSSLLLTLWSFTPLLAQLGTVPETAPAGNLVVKKTVRRVIVDVVVTDSDGNPVRSLTENDFLIKEDGRLQKILSFDKHSLESAYIPPKLPHLPPNTFLDLPAKPERGPLYVLLYDLVNTEVEDQATARKQLIKFIQDKPAGARFAIFVLAADLRMIQGFTDDQKELFAAVDPNAPRRHVPRIFLMGRNSGKGNAGLMVSVFNDIAGFLDGLPGRKNVIWLSGEFPMSLFPTDDDGQTYREEIKETLDLMAKTQIAVYPVDVRGVVVTDSYAPAGASTGGGVTSDYRTGGTPSPTSSGTPPTSSASQPQPTSSSAAPAGGDHGYSLLSASYSTQDEIARTTGGHAFHSNNDLGGGLAQVTEMGANYYTLSYSPTNENYDGNLRKIQVELFRRGYNLSYRRSYYGEDPASPRGHRNSQPSTSATEPSASRPGELLYANMQHGAPMAHAIFFSVHIHPTAPKALATTPQMEHFAGQPAFAAKRPKDKRGALIQIQPYVADFFVPTLQFSGAGPGSSTANANLEFTTVAYDEDGKILNSIVQLVDRGSDAGDPSVIQRAGYHVLQSLDVPVTAASIRVGVRDRATDHIGTLEVPLPLAPEPPVQAATTPH